MWNYVLFVLFPATGKKLLLFHVSPKPSAISVKSWERVAVREKKVHFLSVVYGTRIVSRD